MHGQGADLQLDRLALGTDHCRVQRLVHVELRHRDVVLEPARHRLPGRVDDAERGVAVAHRVNQDADAHQVIDVGEVATAHDHLLVDRVVVLRAAGDGGLHPGGLQVAGHRLDDLGEVGVPGRRPLGHQPDDLVVPLRVEGREREILQLPFDRVHAQPVRERSQHLERLAGDPLLLVRRQEPERAHVVQPVGQLDDQHPRVARHRDDHLADRLGLSGIPILDLVQLRHTVDAVGDLGVEVALELVECVPGVLDGVVQQRGDQRGAVHAQLGQDRGHRERMGDIRVAALAELAAMVLLGDVVGALQDTQVRLWVSHPVGGHQRFQDGLDQGWALTAGGQPAGQPGADPAPVGGAILAGRLRSRIVVVQQRQPG